jgi:hypothetical protein
MTSINPRPDRPVAHMDVYTVTATEIETPSQDDDGVVWDQSQHKYVYREST